MIDGGISVTALPHLASRAVARHLSCQVKLAKSAVGTNGHGAGCPTCGPLSGAKRTLCARSEYFAF